MEWLFVPLRDRSLVVLFFHNARVDAVVVVG